MSASVHDDTRRVYPRWRDIGQMLLSPEARSIGGRSSQDVSEVDKRIRDWEAKGTDENASEAVFAATVTGIALGNHPVVAQILDHSSSLKPGLVRVARKMLGESDEGIEPQSALAYIPTVSELCNYNRKRISIVRRKLRAYPQNSLLWLECGRLYTTLGQFEKAKSSIVIAYALGRANRVITRCAARFYLHAGDPEQALWVLRRAPGAADPWLLAPALSVASVLGQSGKMMKVCTSLSKSLSAGEYSSSELNSAIATVLLEDGRTKQAKKHLRASLVNPTENVVAQGEWLSHKLGLGTVPANLLELPKAYEARAEQYRRHADWDAFVTACREWCSDEVYSTRGPATGSYVSAVALGNADVCEEFAVRGLMANPNDPILLNNYAVSLALRGDISKAISVFEQIRKDDSEDDAIYEPAFRGLVAYRNGDIGAGRALYDQAIKGAVAKKEKSRAAIALLHQIQEELIARTPESVHLLEEAEKLVGNTNDTEVREMLRRLRGYTEFARKVT